MARQGYAKLSNGLWLNDKVNDLIDANPHAFAMWTLAISYCSDELNDGVLSKRALRRIGADEQDLTDLVRFAMLDDLGDGTYRIHDYLKHQNSREEVEKDKTAAKERMRRNRAAKRSPEPESTESETETDPAENRSREVRPNTNRTDNERSDEVRAKFLGLNQNQNQNQESSNEDSLPQTPSQAEGAGENAPENEYTPEFEQFWATYPRHEGKRKAFAAFQRARRKTNHVLLLAKASLYAADPNRDPGYTLTPANWLNGEHWLDDPLPAKPKPDQPDPADEHARQLTDIDWLCTHLDNPEAQLAALDLPDKAQATARARYPDEWYRLWRRGQALREKQRREETKP